MNRFTRLTVVGSVRRADVVVPSDEELAVLVPGLLDLVEEPPPPARSPSCDRPASRST